MHPEEWQRQPIGNICTSIVPGRNKPKVFDGDIPWVTTPEITGKYIPSTNQKNYISTDAARECGAKIVPPGSVVIAAVGELGLTAITTMPLVLNQQLHAFVCPEYISNEYLAYWLSAQKSYMDRVASKTTIPYMNKSNCEGIPVAYPTLKEQTKIAQILSIWDEAIELTEKLIENSKAQQKALMQQLLTGNKRFQEFVQSAKTTPTKYGPIPADWSFVAINEVAKDQVERAGDDADYPVLSCSKYDGFVDSLKYFKKKVYSDDTSNYKVVRRGCFGFPSNHIEEGSIGYQDVHDAGIVSPIYSVFQTNEQVHDSYLYKLLKTDHYRQIFQANTNASVDRRGSLRWKEFGKIRIPLPSVEEQKKIATILSTAEQEISNLTEQLENLNNQKKALMQQLLTGKRRVNIEENTA